VSTASPQKGGETRPDFLARFLAAVPLLVLYFTLAALYAWQASRRPVPTIFTDEVELTQLSRAIAHTGEPARRGVPYDSLATLVAYLLAPVWWLGSAAQSYATAKLVLVLTMTATVFPAYGLARMVVPKWYALAAAAAAVAVPALAYAPFLVEEPLAYPVATLALWLIARCLERPTWGRAAAAAVLCVVGALTRTQLAILVVVLVLGLLWIGWQSELIRGWRSTWSGWDWVGAVTLACRDRARTRRGNGSRVDRVAEHDAALQGSLRRACDVGFRGARHRRGVLPVVAGISALARPKAEEPDPRTRAFVVTSIAALGIFVAYAGVKGAYNSTVFGTYVVERNLIYLCPILFIATALAFARGVGRGWAIAGAGIFTLIVVARTPLHLDFPYYEAHGFSIATLANREFHMSKELIEGVLIGVVGVAFLVVVALKLVRPRSTAFTVIAASAAVVVLAWGLTGQVYAAQGERDFSEFLDGGLPKPNDWVQEATNGGSVVVLGQQIIDATNIQLTEFFNPAIKLMWSLDGSAINVGGPILTPDPKGVDGTLTPVPGTQYVLAVNGLELQAPIVARRKDAVLYRIDGGPIKLKDALVGQQTDGWMVGSSEDPVARRLVHAVRRLGGRARLRERPADARGLGARARSPPDGQGNRAHRPVGSARQAAANRARDGDSALRRPRLRGAGRHAARPPRDVPWRHGDHGLPDVRPEGRSTRRRARAASSVLRSRKRGFQPLFGG
jgi:hypothetical protein